MFSTEAIFSNIFDPWLFESVGKERTNKED